MHKFALSIILFSLLLLSSCFKDDEAVQPYPGDVVLIDKNIEQYTSYFDFETGKVVKTHAVNAWQLGFECSPEGWHIIVNSGDYWFAYNSGQTNFLAVETPGSSETWEYDVQHAYPDSTAIGSWVSLSGNYKIYTNNVYLIGKQVGNSQQHQHLVQFIEVNDTAYVFRMQQPNENTIDTFSINKLDSVNFVYFNFDQYEQVNLEPDKSRYDLVFCSYFDLATYFGLTIPYLVRGTLLNVANTSAVLDSASSYSQVNYEDISNYQLSDQRDVIGYRWKSANIEISAGSAEYAIKPNYWYLVKTQEDNWYKMRFLSFSLDGSSGFPQFEYKLLRPLE